jgi:peptidoglycan hydrolase CwlO-like protein
MATFTEFVALQSAHNARVSAGLQGISADIDSLNAKIQELINTPGELNAEQQAVLDSLLAQSGQIADTAERLDGMTPPAVPNP